MRSHVVRLLLLAVLIVMPMAPSTAQAAPLGAGTYDDANPAVTYTGAWEHVTNIANAGWSTLSWTNVAGSQAQFTFTAQRSISLLYSMASNRGTTNILIDGAQVDSFPSYAPDTRRQVVKNWRVAAGTHTITVRAGGGGFIDIDAFAVDIATVGPGGQYDDRASILRYVGTWQQNSTYTFTNVPGSFVRFTFVSTNTYLVLLYAGTPDGGIANITVDGVNIGTLDFYNLTGGTGIVGIPFPPPSPSSSTIHTLHIQVTGAKSPDSFGSFIYIDSLGI